MSDRADIAELEQHLREAPDDTRSWLVYADWLVEQGDVRGQVLQWEHQLQHGHLEEEERAALRRRISEALGKNRKAWLAGWALPPGVRLEWRGGFVRRAAGFIGTSPALALLWAPCGRFLQALALSPVGDVTPLVQAAETRWLRELAVEGGTIDLRPLAHTTGLSSLRTLTLRRTGVEGAGALLRWPGLGGLVELALEGAGLDDDWAVAFAAALGSRSWAAAPVGTLRRLDLARNRIGDRGAEALAASPHLRGLERLRLAHNEIGDRGAAALAAGTTAEVDLSDNQVSTRTWVHPYDDADDDLYADGME